MIIKQGSLAPFDGALLPKSDFAVCVKCLEARPKLETALKDEVICEPEESVAERALFFVAGIGVGALSALLMISRP
jgi:hypothetical protein